MIYSCKVSSIRLYRIGTLSHSDIRQSHQITTAYHLALTFSPVSLVLQDNIRDQDMAASKPARTEAEEEAHQARKAVREEKRRIHEEKKIRRKEKREQGQENSTVPPSKNFLDFDSGEDLADTTVHVIPFVYSYRSDNSIGPGRARSFEVVQTRRQTTGVNNHHRPCNNQPINSQDHTWSDSTEAPHKVRHQSYA